MNRSEFNLHENRFILNIDLVFSIIIHEWLEDIKDGNNQLVPKTLDEAKEKILTLSKELIIIPPSYKTEEINIYFNELRIPWALIREDMIRLYISNLFIDKNEVIELGLMAGWI